ncbi:MAG: hypothetical protein GF388_01545, partial [Candidatus Aegiribacteria sp.]|nr:hypothetical protein [Candidatus Aegiribacteria sp.]MBD3294058.1 hypothetical protein [Candidatus Fermentibacteria bacterium]
MRNRWYLYFWTELGRRILGESTPIPKGLPESMARVVRDHTLQAEESVLSMGAKLNDRKTIHIYKRGWKLLREEGFRRPLRLQPWPEVDLLIPFWRSSGHSSIGVIPQSFSSRVPYRKRALAMVGKTAAASAEGVELWILAGSWNEEVLDVFRSGGVNA